MRRQGQFAYTSMVLKKILLMRKRVENWQDYPFCVPSIRSLEEIHLNSRICFFVGENGSGKSTLLEALAVHYGFGREGGTRNFFNSSTKGNQSIDPLVRSLRLSFDSRTGAGFYLRAESLFNVASHIDQSDEEQAGDPGLPIASFYGQKSLHSRSHGEAFFTLFDLKCRRDGLFLLDEPEAALSPQRQVAFVFLLHETLCAYHDAQFIISTHSPLLLGFPKAQIMSFDGERIKEICYEDTNSFQIYRRFLNDPRDFLKELYLEAT
jgi:predicted ATPase